MTAISIIVAFISGFFCAIKAINVGMVWQTQISRKQEPTVSNPVTQIFNKIAESKAVQQQDDTLDEWLNGAKEVK